MNKLRTILAAALLTMPVIALNASTAAEEPTGIQVSSPPQQSCCWILIMGRWYCYYC